MVDGVQFSDYAPDGSRYISRRDAAMFFAKRAVMLAVFFGSAFGGILVASQLYRGISDQIMTRSCLPVLQVWVATIPLIFLMALNLGDGLWRSVYREPKQEGLIFKYRQVLWIFFLGLAIYKHDYDVVIILIVLFLEVELLLYRSRFSLRSKEAPSDAIVYFMCFAALAFQIVYIAFMSPTLGESALAIQQLFIFGSVIIHEAFACRGLVRAWYLAGRLPSVGNPHFQISVSTALKLSLFMAVWMALLFWAFSS